MKRNFVRETGRHLAGWLKEIGSQRRCGAATRGYLPTGRDGNDVVPESCLRRLLTRRDSLRPAFAVADGETLNRS